MHISNNRFIRIFLSKRSKITLVWLYIHSTHADLEMIYENTFSWLKIGFFFFSVSAFEIGWNIIVF